MRHAASSLVGVWSGPPSVRCCRVPWWCQHHPAAPPLIVLAVSDPFSVSSALTASCVSSAFQHRVSAVPYSTVCVTSNFQHRVSPVPVSHSTAFACVSNTVVQAIKKQWKEAKQLDADSDTDPLTDVEYDDQPVESDAGGGETPGGSLAAAGTSSQRHTQEHTPPPAKRQKKQVSTL